MNDPSRTGEHGPETLRSASADQTRRLGEALGGLLRAGDVVLLQGELGTGKTAFTQGIGRGLGVAAPVNSPTFTLLKEYAGRLPLYHFDLYRVDDPAELEALGFEQYFEGDGVSVVEWAERGESDEPDSPSPWPPAWLRVRILATGESERLLICTAHGTRGAALLEAFARAASAGSTTKSATSATPDEKSANSATSEASVGVS